MHFAGHSAHKKPHHHQAVEAKEEQMQGPDLEPMNNVDHLELVEVRIMECMQASFSALRGYMKEVAEADSFRQHLQSLRARRRACYTSELTCSARPKPTNNLSSVAVFFLIAAIYLTLGYFAATGQIQRA
mmetsp:Transcript_42402/g.84948  ORF Transcript_42402/g.84948 Transcript_42402/m.84948 type:complete len:130 (+) Transcript_42402:1-390(+)